MKTLDYFELLPRKPLLIEQGNHLKETYVELMKYTEGRMGVSGKVFSTEKTERDAVKRLYEERTELLSVMGKVAGKENITFALVLDSMGIRPVKRFPRKLKKKLKNN